MNYDTSVLLKNIIGTVIRDHEFLNTRKGIENMGEWNIYDKKNFITHPVSIVEYGYHNIDDVHMTM